MKPGKPIDAYDFFYDIKWIKFSEGSCFVFVYRPLDFLTYSCLLFLELENRLLQRFDAASQRRELSAMAECAKILSQVILLLSKKCCNFMIGLRYLLSVLNVQYLHLCTSTTRHLVDLYLVFQMLSVLKLWILSLLHFH